MRYTQQIIVEEWGVQGQQKIAAAKVLVVGAGGLGTPLAVYLAAAGVGTIGIADADRIAETNLHRQFLYQEQDLGQSKVESLAAKLRMQNPALSCDTYPFMITVDNALNLLQRYDIICDCTDDAATRILLDKTCNALRIPLVYAAVKDWEAYIAVLHHQKKITLADIFSLTELKENALLNCATAGIVNTTCGIAGSFQANEVFKIVLGMESELDGGIGCLNAAVPLFRIFKLQSSSAAN